MKFCRWALHLCFFSFFGTQICFSQVSELNGTVRIEAENYSELTPRTNGVVEYNWAILADPLDATSAFSGVGYLQATTSDGISTTIETSWEATSPRLDYTIRFKNAGTYYVWFRGYATSATSAGIYLGMAGSGSPTVRMDLQQFNDWAWCNTPTGSATPVVVNVSAPGEYTLQIWMRDSVFVS